MIGRPMSVLVPAVTCGTCGDTGWLCAATDKPADFTAGTCCDPGWSEYGYLGPGCPSANGCPDCDRASEAAA